MKIIAFCYREEDQVLGKAGQREGCQVQGDEEGV